VPSSGIIDLAIGLTFVFGTTAALSSVWTELIARLLGLREAYLLAGLQELLDSSQARTNLATAEFDYLNMQNFIRGGTSSPPELLPPSSATGALLGSPILRSQGMTGDINSRDLILVTGRLGPPTVRTSSGKRPWSALRTLPAYISSRSFAEAVIDLVLPDAAGHTTMATISRNIHALPDNMPLKTSLQVLAKNADTDVSRFRAAVEAWYDDHMDRVSGWYKRHTAKITLVVGAILVVLLNINALTMGRALYTQSTVSSAISTVAAKDANCPASQTRQDCLAALQAEISAAATAGLPIGWGTVRDCTAPGARCNWLDKRGIFSQHGNSGWQLVQVLLGFLIMIIALVPGARFWFGLLSKLGALRTTGPKPTPAGS
jgi:hypothetical protein